MTNPSSPAVADPAAASHADSHDAAEIAAEVSAQVAAGKGLLPDQIRTLYQQSPASLAGNLIGAVVVIAMFWRVAPTHKLATWAAIFAVVWLLRAWHYKRYPALEADAVLQRRWGLRWNVYVLLSSAAWGAGVLLFYGTGSVYHSMALVLVVYSYSLGAVQILATQPRVCLGFLALSLVPTVIRIGLDPQPFHLELAGIMVLLFLTTALMGRTFRQAFETTITLKVRTERLAVQLSAEKAVAEEARREAETANRAKTQFFAAASHDLRQPLHAMGLFAEALRAQSRGNEEVTHLVNSINSSVDALEGLFGELLDITKIDTGGVEPQPQHFALRELFQRLKLQYEPTAFEKGLDLRFRGAAHVVYADPVLVDRIVRNLLSNAIRYTEDGGVLVSARRRGEALLLQVWDTGIGIAPAEQARVFDEFYQVQANAPLELHQSKGLGLGLSIVQRLARLMEAPLGLSSQPGHGTVFTLRLPLGKLPRAAPLEAAGMKRGLGLTLEHRRIVVVEDEPSVREGLVVLLRGWGADVIALDSHAAVEAWLATTPPLPDLAIVDYRLPHARTGIEVLATLRAAFAETLPKKPLPAIVVTGSTMSGHEEESARHDFHLLVKPVAPNKLRAMIAFKLGMR